MSKQSQQPSALSAPKKKKREDFQLSTILGEGSYSTVSIRSFLFFFILQIWTLLFFWQSE